MLPHERIWNCPFFHLLFARSQKKNLVPWWVLWSVLVKSWPSCRVTSMLSLLRSELTSGRAFTSETRILRAALHWVAQLCDCPYFLGYRWVCDDSVTHYIYQGRVGDNSREYRGVKDRRLHVVSQYWLHAVCFHVIIVIMQVVEVFKFLANNKWPILSCSVLRSRSMFQRLCIHSTTTQKWAWISVRYPAALRSLQTEHSEDRPLS